MENIIIIYSFYSYIFIVLILFIYFIIHFLKKKLKKIEIKNFNKKLFYIFVWIWKLLKFITKQSLL